MAVRLASLVAQESHTISEVHFSTEASWKVCSWFFDPDLEDSLSIVAADWVYTSNGNDIAVTGKFPASLALDEDVSLGRR